MTSHYLTSPPLTELLLPLRVHDVRIFVVIDFVSVHFYDPPVLFILQNPGLDHFVVDIVNARNTFHRHDLPLPEIRSATDQMFTRGKQTKESRAFNQGRFCLQLFGQVSANKQFNI